MAETNRMIEVDEHVLEAVSGVPFKQMTMTDYARVCTYFNVRAVLFEGIIQAPFDTKPFDKPIVWEQLTEVELPIVFTGDGLPEDPMDDHWSPDKTMARRKDFEDEWRRIRATLLKHLNEKTYGKKHNARPKPNGS